jgi:hypothetical protein
MAAKSPAARQRARRARGVVVSCVLTSPEAIAALRAAKAAHGTIPAALGAALGAWAALAEAPGVTVTVVRRARGHDQPGGAASAPAGEPVGTE